MGCSFFYALWISLIVVAPCTLAGFTFGFSAVALPELNLTLDESSWFGCLFPASAPFGCIMTGYVIEKFGRKASLLLAIVPAAFGWFILAVTSEVAILFLGRILTGFATGAAFIPAQMYMVEFLDIDPSLYRLRSSFTNWVNAISTFGYLLLMLLGALMFYQKIAFIAFLISVFGFIGICFFIPESPVWLYQKGRYEEAERSQARLKVSAAFENYPLLSTKKEDEQSMFQKLKRRDVYIPLFITTGCYVLMNFAGFGVYTSYMIYMIGGSKSISVQESYNLSIVSGILLFSSNVIVLFVIPRVGIRKVAIGTSFGVTVSLFVYGISKYFLISINETFMHGLSVVAIWLGLFCQGFGYVSIPRAVLAELFPSDAKGLATIPTIVMYLLNAFVIKFHPHLLVMLGGYIYLIYTLFSALQMLFMYCFLPETVGKTVKEITNEFR